MAHNRRQVILEIENHLHEDIIRLRTNAQHVDMSQAYHGIVILTMRTYEEASRLIQQSTLNINGRISRVKELRQNHFDIMGTTICVDGVAEDWDNETIEKLFESILCPYEYMERDNHSNTSLLVHFRDVQARNMALTHSPLRFADTTLVFSIQEAAFPAETVVSQDRYRGTKNEVRIILIGKTGSGKSATANTLLGRQQSPSAFGASSVSMKCHLLEGRQDGRKIVLVDTPGLFDTRQSKEAVKREMRKCIAMTSPGPHAIVLVVQAGRTTQEEAETVKLFVEYFGETVYKYMLILFTRMDDMTRGNVKLTDYVTTIPGTLQTVLKRCSNRYVGFNNKAEGYDRVLQVKRFWYTVTEIITSNGDLFYTNQMYEAAEKALQRRLKEREREIEAEKQHAIEKIQAEYRNKAKGKINAELRAAQDKQIAEVEKKMNEYINSNDLRGEQRAAMEQEKSDVLSELIRKFHK